MERRFMRRMLLVIDPQVDFITGSLPVAGAKAAMDALGKFLLSNDGRYAHKVVTADCHPFDHCSFIGNGGQWPPHCIHDTVGAALWPSLLEPLYVTSGRVTFLHKGESRDVEEYSIFRNRHGADSISRIVSDEMIDVIDVCGIAGDVCVAESIIDGLELLGDVKFNVLKKFTPSIDNGVRLESMISELNLTCE